MEEAAEEGERCPFVVPFAAEVCGFFFGREVAADGRPDFGFTAGRPLRRRAVVAVADLGLRLRARARFSRSESESFSSGMAFEFGEYLAAELVMGAK